MPHQDVREWNRDFDELTKDMTDDELNASDIDETIPVDLSTWKVLKEWTFTHWGGTGQDWRQEGKIVIYDSGIEDTYLEASIKDVPFFSLLSSLDQWGTWHTFKLSQFRENPQREKEDEVIYGQEWGNPSFLEALGAALTYMARHTEPDPELYRMPYEELKEKGMSCWRRESD